MTIRSTTSKRAWSRRSVGLVGVIPCPHTIMMRSTSIGVRAGVGVAVPITTVGAPGVDGWEGVEMVIGDPLDGCRETVGDSRVGVVDAVPCLEDDGAWAGVESVGGVGVTEDDPADAWAAGCAQYGTGAEPEAAGTVGREVGAWATSGGAELGATGAGPGAVIFSLFVLGMWTCFHTIRFPNTTRASPSCCSVPCIETWHSSAPSMANK